MPRYKVVVEFDTDNTLSENLQGELQADMVAQLESLYDGSFEERGHDKVDVLSVSSDIKEIS